MAQRKMEQTVVYPIHYEPESQMDHAYTAELNALTTNWFIVIPCCSAA